VGYEAIGYSRFRSR